MPPTEPSPAGKNSPPASERYPSHWRSPAVLPAAILVLTGLLVSVDSTVALALVLLDGSVAVGVLALAALAGMWLVDLIGLGKSAWRDRLLLGAGLGIGGLSLAMLAVGAMGWVHPGGRWLVGLVIVAGLLRAIFDLRKGAEKASWFRPEKASPAKSERSDSEQSTPVTAGPTAQVEQARRRALALEPFHYLWLIAAPFLAITVLAATMPPGMLWGEEAFGYDVLAYHLAVPKEFYEAGRIFFMPYNVYSNMPLNSSMLWLLMMELRGDAIEGTFTVKGVNIGLALLFVAAAWWTGRIYSRRAGVIAGVLAASTPWLAYLAGIAYVEPGMLAMGMLALGAMLRAAGSETAPKRWAIAAGLLAGMACGYKYTAVPLIAGPLVLIVLLAGGNRGSGSFCAQHPPGRSGKMNPTPFPPRLSGRAWSERLKQVGLFAVAALLTFSPWMVRNLINTGNPVFPLAYSVFGAKPGVWDAELQARWERGHGWEGAAWDGGTSPLKVALDRTVFDVRLGWGLVILALAGAAIRRDRWTVALLLVLALQVLIWFCATHLFARFATVMLLPLIILAARLAPREGSPLPMAALSLLVVLAAGRNLYRLGELYYIHTQAGPTAQPLNAHGHVNWFVNGEWPGYDYLNYVNVLEGDPRVMFVGEARTFYVLPPRDYAVVFSRHPLAAAVRELVGPARPVEPGEPAPSVPAPPADPNASPEVTLAAEKVSGSFCQHGPESAAHKVNLTPFFRPALEAEPDYRPVVKWLADRGVTHLLVHWLELQRLRSTYGLDPELSFELFAELESAGLLRMGDFMIGDNGMPYATLYEVPHE